MNQILRTRLGVIRTFALVGVVAGVAVGLILGGGLDGRPLPGSGVRGGLVGGLVGVAMGIGEELVFPGWSRHLGFAALNFIRVTAYALLIMAALVTVNIGYYFVFDPDLELAVQEYASDFMRDFGTALPLAVVLTAALQIRRLHNPGEILRLLTGKYHYPEEESRVFLFADLASSTSLAERLGHLEFSNLLRDFFSDISQAILAWRGQVYQHLGDGVIVTWQMEDGIEDARPSARSPQTPPSPRSSRPCSCPGP